MSPTLPPITTIPTIPVLEELYARAGASDQDREAWLAERRTGVTATEVAQLAKRRGAARKAFARDLIAEKLGRAESSFSGNAYTEWGKLREPVLAEVTLRSHMLLPESRVFHAVDEPRFLASPDAVGIDFDEVLRVAEFKTSGKDLEDDDEFAATGYEHQVQWVMRVTGAARCLFMWEQRIGEPGDFRAGIQFSRWIERDEKAIAQLEKVAREFLVALDEAAAEEGPAKVDAELDRLVWTHLTAKAAATSAEEDLRAYLDANGVQAEKTDRWSLTYQLAEPGVRFDSTGFKAAHPDLYQEFQKTTEPGKPTLRITPAKADKKEGQTNG